MSNLDAYTGRAEDYAKYRPAYAPDAISALIELTGLDSTWVVADVGSGTGNLSRHLLGHANRIVAIEPNEDMRQQAELSLGSSPGFSSINATAEATTLPDESVDLVTAGQALHWFDPIPASREFARILKPPKLFAVIWNRFDEGAELPETAGFLSPSDSKHASFVVSFRESWEGFIGGARSVAHAPLVGDPEYAEYLAAHERSFAARAIEGKIEFQYSTELIVGPLSR